MSATATAEPTTFAEAEVALAENLPGYESRPQQQTLALAVETALASRSGHLLAEAGCGTGKSLGYLIPSILSGQRVIVSTATKALQDQIANKDLPFLAENLGRPFSYALLKGRSNYACMAKINDPDVQSSVPLPGVMRTLEEMAANSDFMAERDDFTSLDDQSWRKITVSSEECPGKKECPFGQQCFAEKAKAKAKAADVVVVNHALFLTDLKMKVAGIPTTMLDEYDAVVFDEAHEIEEYAGGVFGSQFTEAGVRNMASEARNFAKKYLDEEQAAHIEELVEDVLTTLAALWLVLKPGTVRIANLMDAADQFVDFTNALGALAKALKAPKLLDHTSPVGYETARDKRNRITKKITGLYDRFEVIVTGTFEDYVRWVEEDRTPRGEKRKVLKVAPVSVATILRDALFANPVTDVTAVLASATLSVGGKFDYITDRLGIDNAEGIDVGTPFDYAAQSALYIPKHLPDPGKEREQWASMAIFEMGELVKASKGRALLLFTSYTAMKTAYDMLAPRLPYTCLMQGQMPNKALAEAFMADKDSVLFGTRSFMTGVDFQGEACSLVVVDKLPFPVPTEPLTEARCDKIKADGGNDFAQYTVPVMTLILKQAFGRLIRHRNDKGVVAILDPRLMTKGYGKGIVNSLPPAKRMTQISEVQEFFDE